MTHCMLNAIQGTISSSNLALQILNLFCEHWMPILRNKLCFLSSNLYILCSILFCYTKEIIRCCRRTLEKKIIHLSDSQSAKAIILFQIFQLLFLSKLSGEIKNRADLEEDGCAVCEYRNRISRSILQTIPFYFSNTQFVWLVSKNRNSCYFCCSKIWRAFRLHLLIFQQNLLYIWKAELAWLKI